MSTENNSVDLDDNLDDFSASFFGQKEATPEPASSEEVTEEVTDQVELDAPNETDTHEEGDDAPDIEEDGEADLGGTDEDEEPAPEPTKKRKQTAQERINEVVGQKRETERQLQEALAKLERYQQGNEPAPTAPVVEQKVGPQPTDQNEDGTDKYPLGEFDPNYIRDLTRHSLEVEREEFRAREAKERQQAEQDSQKAALVADWNEKLGPAQERYPDFMERGEELLGQFQGIDPSYGEYLTSTIMGMEYGTDVLYYLASNPDEATRIINSGPAKATVALGRVEAKFEAAAEERKKARPKVSKAPTPPAHVNKGSAAAKIEVDPDTDDLDAFSGMFFSKKK